MTESAIVIPLLPELSISSNFSSYPTSFCLQSSSVPIQHQPLLSYPHAFTYTHALVRANPSRISTRELYGLNEFAPSPSHIPLISVFFQTLQPFIPGVNTWLIDQRTSGIIQDSYLAFVQLLALFIEFHSLLVHLL